MSCVNNTGVGCASTSNCPGCDGCIPGVCANFQIKRNDTKPAFKIPIEQDGEPMDLTGLVIEANMWANAKLKTNITVLDTCFSLVNNIGFCQILVNDVILMDRPRSPEQMRILGFDETKNLIYVERGYNGTMPQTWNRGQVMRIFRFINSPAMSEMLYDDVMQVDGTTNCNVLTDSFLVYEWNVNDTCIPGCFSFEFKVMKMTTDPIMVPSVIPSCFLGVGVEWTRRYPNCGEYLIKVCDSPTSEVTIPPSTANCNNITPSTTPCCTNTPVPCFNGGC